MMIATFENDTLTVSGAYDLTLTVKQVENAWNGLSHFPDRRARLELDALGERLTNFADHVRQLTAMGGKFDPEWEMRRFASRHVSLTRRAWAMDSRCMSWFVTGPAKFPTDRNRKRMDWADNAYLIVRKHLDTARKAVERIAFPHGSPGDAIRSSNPDAPELIRAEIAKRTEKHAMMKAANAAIRSVKHRNDTVAMIQAVVDATGWRENTARRVVIPPQEWMGRGFPAYELSGQLAEIKRLQGRLKTIEANRARGHRVQHA